MKVGKIYLEWVRYLKEKGLYVKFMRDYAYANELINFRKILIKEGRYWEWAANSKLKDFNHRFFNCKDYILIDKGNNMSFDNLRYGMENLAYHLPSFRGIEWNDIVLDFGEKHGYYKKPKIDSSTYWGLDDFEWTIERRYSEATTRTEPVRVVRAEPNVGQWYDRFYNRGRNFNNRNNNRYNDIRWRR